MFEKAIELDPRFAAAFAFLGRVHITEWAMGWSQGPQTLGRAFELAQRAVALDGSLPTAYLALGFVYLWEKQHGQAIAETEKSITLDPNFAEGYAALGDILNYAGRPGEAIELLEKAMHLDPYYPVAYLFNLGRAHYLLRQYEEAIAVLKRVLTRNPDHASTYGYLGAIYSELGRLEEARDQMAEALRLNPAYSLSVARQRLPYKDPAELE